MKPEGSLEIYNFMKRYVFVFIILIFFVIISMSMVSQTTRPCTLMQFKQVNNELKNGIGRDTTSDEIYVF